MVCPEYEIRTIIRKGKWEVLEFPLKANTASLGGIQLLKPPFVTYAVAIFTY
jgi:hypothetical protein